MVSVVIPIYNTERYLRDCLDSLENQTYTDFEAVMVNDGSSDSSPAIAAEYAARDSRFRLFNKENGGMSSARNTGLAKAAGNYIFFLDSDDELHPEALERLVKGLESHPEAQMCVAKGIWTEKPSYRLTGNMRLKDGRFYLKSFLYQKRIAEWNVGSFLIKRELIEKTGPFIEGIMYEDLAYCFSLARNSEKVVLTEDVYYFYRRDTGGVMGKWKEKRLDVLDVVDDFVAQMEHEGKSLTKAARSRRFSAYFNMFLLATANGHTEGADRCWPVIKELRAQMILDPEVRLKNKLGAALSYFGRRVTSMFARK